MRKQQNDGRLLDRTENWTNLWLLYVYIVGGLVEHMVPPVVGEFLPCIMAHL